MLKQNGDSNFGTSTLPKSDKQYFTTIKSMKEFPNGESVRLKTVISQNGIFDISSNSKDDSSKKVFLCSETVDASKCTFIQYSRLDGKPEEIRLDRLQIEGFAIPDIRNADSISYADDIQPFIDETSFHLSKFVTDWPRNNSKEYTISDKDHLAKYGITANYIRADRTYLEFESMDQKKSYSFADILTKKVALEKTDNGMKSLYQLSQQEAFRNHQTQLCDDEPASNHQLENTTKEVNEIQIGKQNKANSTQQADEPSNDTIIGSSIQSEASEGAAGSSKTVTFSIEVSNDSTTSISVCPFCMMKIKSHDSFAVLTEKGVTGILAAAKRRMDDGLVCMAGQKIHKECRKKYTDSKLINISVKKRTERERSESPSLRSQTRTFDSRAQCFYCTDEIKDLRNESQKVRKCQTLGFEKKVLQQCDERKDEWSDKVKGRLSSINDLFAADAVYHLQCCNNFRNGQSMPSYCSIEVQEPKR